MKSLSAVVGGIIVLMVIVMFLNRGSLILGASPQGAKFYGSY